MDETISEPSASTTVLSETTVKNESISESTAPQPNADVEGGVAVEASEEVDMEETEEMKKNRACRQVEFYFADSNLPYDRFMWTLHTADKDHWISIPTIASFKRMREFSAHGVEWVVSAIKLSKELEVNEESTKVRRRTEVKEPEGQFERSIYAKGFGEERKGLQLELETFFSKYGPVNAVRMRREYHTNVFKGSVFCEFANMDSVKRFLEAEPKPSWKGNELLIMSKEAYCEMKIKEKGLSGKAANLRRQSYRDNPGRNFNAFRDTDKQEKDKKAGKAQPKPDVFLEFMGTKIRVHEEDGGSIKDGDVPYVKNTALKFTGFGGEIQWDEIKNPLKDRFERAPFIKYQKGDEYALVGFNRALTDEDFSYVKESVKTVNGNDVTWSHAEEEEEKAFLIERAQTAAKRVLEIAKNKHGSRNGRGGGRGGRGGGRGNRGGRGGRGRNGPRLDRDTLSSHTKTEAKEDAGEKRKRDVEPDGALGSGTRGATIPTIQPAKKMKTEDSTGSAMSTDTTS